MVYSCQPSAMFQSLIPTSGGMVGIRRGKVRKLLGWDKGSLLGKAAQRINSSYCMAWQVLFTGKLGSMACNGGLGRLMSVPQISSLLLLFPPLYMLRTMPCVMECPFGQLGHLSWVSPPSSLCTHSLLTGGMGWGAEETLTLCKCCLGLTKSPPWNCFLLKSNTCTWAKTRT